jgi:hypothetical protein
MFAALMPAQIRQQGKTALASFRLAMVWFLISMHHNEVLLHFVRGCEC